MSAVNDRADVVFTFSTVTWQAAASRGWFATEDRFARSVMSSDRIDRLIVADHARSWPIKLARDLLDRTPVRFPADERRRHLQPLRWRRRDPTKSRAIARDLRAYDRALERAAADMGMRDPVVITTHPLLAGFAELEWARAVTWYATDDWAAHPGYARWWAGYRESYARLRARRRRVAAVSSVLLERLAPTGPRLVVPNGLDPDEWTGTHAAPQWVADECSRPLLVYVGSLDARLEVAWIRAVARALPSATIALVGPMVDEAHFAGARDVENIQFRPSVDRDALSGLLLAADVGLLPHHRSALTEAMSPLKLFEYLAAGLPVASTDLPPVRALGHPCVILADEVDDYGAAVKRALELGRAPEAERLQFVHENSWRARHDELLDLALA
jgi:glycosyltransferase involved in cell wall biosynthesis